jgi:uncharacterized damage-inducible protein DinB
VFLPRFRKIVDMSSIPMLQALLSHMEWADALVWKSVFESPAARDDSAIRGRLYHMHMVHWSFLHVWLGERLPEIPEQKTFTDITALWGWGHDAHRETMRYMERIDETRLQSLVKIPWLDDFAKYFGKPAAPTSLIQTMLHIASHSSHHRGQVNTRLHEVGSQPPYVDFIVWVCLGKPAAEWTNSGG